MFGRAQWHLRSHWPHPEQALLISGRAALCQKIRYSEALWTSSPFKTLSLMWWAERRTYVCVCLSASYVLLWEGKVLFV